MTEDWKMLEELSYNGRTILAYYNTEEKTCNLMFFNFDEQPNEMSQRGVYTTWGYATYAVLGIHSISECSDLVRLYMDDLFAENHWWEIDG